VVPGGCACVVCARTPLVLGTGRLVPGSRGVGPLDRHVRYGRGLTPRRRGRQHFRIRGWILMVPCSGL